MTKEKIFKYLTEYLMDHAIQCESEECLCRASTFNDALVELREIAPEYDKQIQEIFDRD